MLDIRGVAFNKRIVVPTPRETINRHRYFRHRWMTESRLPAILGQPIQLDLWLVLCQFEELGLDETLEFTL
jgi:hypothetical protein